GFYQDDYIQLVKVSQEHSSLLSRLDLYQFTRGTAETKSSLVDRGPFPWWTPREHKISFFRPIGSLLFNLDYMLWKLDAMPYHIHSLVWYALFIAATSLLYLNVVPSRYIILALLIFAVDDAHWFPVSWIACRHSLITGVFGVLSIWSHVKWRAEKWRAGGLFSSSALILALFSGEAALGTVAYIAAFECIGSSDGRVRRIIALLPSLIIVACYLTAYSMMGYGTYGSGLYNNPLNDLPSFLKAAGVALPMLMADLLAGVQSDFAILLPSITPWLVITGIVFFALFVFILNRAIKSMPDNEQKTISWLALGALLSLLPSLGGFVSGRLLLMPGIGGAVILAVVMQYAFTRGINMAKGWWRRALYVFGWFLVFMHLVLAPVQLGASGILLGVYSRSNEEVAESIEVPDPINDSAVILAGSDPLVWVYTPWIIGAKKGRLPSAFWTISASPCDQEITRTSEKSLQISTIGCTMLQTPFEKLFRSKKIRLSINDTVTLDGLEIRILATEDDLPTRIALTWDNATDRPDHPLVFLAWQGDALRRLQLPPVGSTITWNWTAGPLGL
ncbi:MAG: hypothetical protein HQK54_15010, partial [Oligoflexales bacterium]|nr:hypothetical protein [Oligoflexales bacterium]